MNSFGIDEERRSHWWQIWMKKHGVSDQSLYYLAFIAGWNSGVMYNRKISDVPLWRRIVRVMFGFGT